MKTINALLALKEATPSELQDEPLGYSLTARRAELYDAPPSQILKRGQIFFDKIYGKVAKRIMGQMDRSGTEDLGLTARLMCGYVLSNTNVLTPAESSYILIAGLIPQDVCFTCHPQTRPLIRTGQPSVEGPFERCFEWWSNSGRSQGRESNRDKNMRGSRNGNNRT